MIKKIPDALIIISFILLFFIGLTWIIPAGEYSRKVLEGREMVIPGSFEYTANNPQSIFTFFTAPIKGFVHAAEIIGFVFLIGGAFSIVNATGSINAGLQKVINFSYRNPQYKGWIIPLLMVFFSLAGCTFGMSEEILVFLLITLPLAHALGYDAIVGTAIPFVGAGVGFAGAMFNPFTIGIAQGIAELPPFSGWEYRAFVWLIFTLTGILFVSLYARKISKNKQASLVKHIKPSEKHHPENQEQTPLTGRRIRVLLLFLFTLVLLIFGVNQWGWYIKEIAGLFLGLGILSAVAYRLSLNKTVEAFYEGCKDILPAAIIIAFSRGILVVAQDGKIIDTVLHTVAGSVNELPKFISVQVMFFVQSIINFFIPSGSGQAALTMPVMTPLSDLLGISRQTAVLAYQFGDGISNLVIPTSGVTMGILAIARIPYEIWLKWIWKLILLLTLISMILLALPVAVFTWY